MFDFGSQTLGLMSTKTGVYVLRGASAAVQFVLVLFLGSLSTRFLGEYSFCVAILAVLGQIAQFEGPYLTISGTLSCRDLKRISGTTNVLWMVAVLATVILAVDRIEVSAFVLIFSLNLSTEWLLNVKTVEQRMEGNDNLFRKMLALKVFLIDCSLPLLAIAALWIDFSESKYLLFGALVVLFLVQAFALGIEKPSNWMAPRFSYVFGVLVKRIDTVFVRLFAGTMFGVVALGQIQPMLSLARMLTLITPTWINLNFSQRIKLSNTNRDLFIRLLFGSLVLYLFYFAFAAAVFQMQYFVEIFNYEFSTIIAVVFMFGTQNTKALLRSLHLVQSKLILNNLLLLLGVILKLSVSLLLIETKVLGLIVVCLLVDLFILSFGIIGAWKRKVPNE